MYMAKKQLTGTERDFLRRVSRSIFSNPFSDERVRADVELTGADPSLPYEKRLEKVIQAVSIRIKKLIADNKGDVRDFTGQDRELLENAFMFNIYHRYYDSFDTLILKHIKTPDISCSISFAGEAIRLIIDRGFSRDEAHHYFSVLFQMRRAFHFIDRSILGRSPCMKEFRLNLWNNVFTRDIGLYARYLWNRMEDYSTLLLGETGAGKGLAATAIGRSGYIPFNGKKECFKESFTQAFVSLNLSQYPEQLIESELFGHRKGAFTGAVADHDGIFSRCSPHGAIFLDEIGDVSVPLQIKLLQVLQERLFTPVGSHKALRFSGRVIAATNKAIHKLRAEKIFRDDFYYRLCSDIITVPPLRQRIREDPEELDFLLKHTLERIIGSTSEDLEKKVRDIVKAQVPADYEWPGNVRELEQCIRRILLKHSYTVVDHSLTSIDIAENLAEKMREGSINMQGLLSGYCKILHDKYGTYEAIAKRTGLDRRTAKKYLEIWSRNEGQ